MLVVLIQRCSSSAVTVQEDVAGSPESAPEEGLQVVEPRIRGNGEAAEGLDLPPPRRPLLEVLFHFHQGGSCLQDALIHVVDGPPVSRDEGGHEAGPFPVELLALGTKGDDPFSNLQNDPKSSILTASLACSSCFSAWSRFLL